MPLWFIEQRFYPTMLALIFGILACRLGFRITRPLRREFPFETFGDLTRYVLAKKPLAIKEPDHPWSREDVAVIVREIITEQLGVKDFSDDADFVRDLGVD